MTHSTNKDRPAFPAPIYRETVLAPVFADAKRYFLEPLLEIDYAHILMLARQGIMKESEAAACIHALDGLDRTEIKAAEYDGTFEDLFFYLGKRLAAICGEEIAGKIHTARSRNDIDLTMYRMVLRERLIRIFEALLELRKLLVELAWAYRTALIPAYTHNQPAQPTTLGHYLMAYIEVLERDADRLGGSYTRVNRNPLGACAITTTGFPIDRSFTTKMLGFDGLQVNSYGAIAAVDYLVESCGVLATSMLSMGRFVQDLLLWSTVEFSYLRLSDAYVQISSIMPQKRNPVPLEHVRVLASRALVEAQGVVGSLHNTPFADMNDAEDDMQPLVYTAFDDAERGIRLLTGALREAEFNTERMAAAADANFLPVTELADTLVRNTGMSFHSAHTIVSKAVRELRGAYDADVMTSIVSTELEGRYTLSPDKIREALRAENFVAVRKVVGGPALEALEPEVLRARDAISHDSEWMNKRRLRLAEAHDALRVASDTLAGTKNGR